MAKNYKNRADDKPRNATNKDKDGEAIFGEENVGSFQVSKKIKSLSRFTVVSPSLCSFLTNSSNRS